MPSQINPVDGEFYIILDALDRGTEPSESAALELVALGLLEAGSRGWQMTASAHEKLQFLRNQLTDTSEIELFSGDVTSWSTTEAPIPDPGRREP